jgi:hypothetical protein
LGEPLRRRTYGAPRSRRAIRSITFGRAAVAPEVRPAACPSVVPLLSLSQNALSLKKTQRKKATSSRDSLSSIGGVRIRQILIYSLLIAFTV